MKRLIQKLKRLRIILLQTLKKIIWSFKKKTTIWMVGDSTMCKYDKSFGPVTGWGMPFANYFDDTVTTKNKARGGYSTKTYIEQDFWQPVANQLKKGDYVLIQFGHNDENISEPNIYTSPEDYRVNLLKFIAETKAKNANPVLFTPVARRRFDAHGQVIKTHSPYADIVREVAKSANLPLVDLDQLTRDLLQQLGDENSKMLFNYLLPNEDPYHPNGDDDDEHFNELGARKTAQLALSEIRRQQLGLAAKIVKI